LGIVSCILVREEFRQIVGSEKLASSKSELQSILSTITDDLDEGKNDASVLVMFIQVAHLPLCA
jgi:hypothetical protein